MRYILLFGLGFSASTTLFGQLNFDHTEGKILLKGQVADLQTKSPLSSASIVISNRKRGMVADADGNFQIYVYPTDTLLFSHTGYIPKEIAVSGIPEEMRYTLRIDIIRDFYKLKQVTIYPYSSKREFADAFIKGTGVPENVLIPGMEAPKYIHKEKSKFFNPISAIYDRVKNKRRAADPDFRP